MESETVLCTWRDCLSDPPKNSILVMVVSEAEQALLEALEIDAARVASEGRE